MTHDGLDCLYCENSFTDCRCREAFEFLNCLYGWNIEDAKLRRFDIRAMALIFEENVKPTPSEEGK